MSVSLDILIEEKIFGKKPCVFRNTGMISGIMLFFECEHKDSRNCYPSNLEAINLIPKYSEDISHAWKIVEKMQEKGYNFSCQQNIHNIKIWSLAEFSKDHKMTYASGDYKCLAEEICKAALYTIQTEEEN